ncbi:MAG: nucleotide exchange factor GrpE [bacterium]|nr:nucleotide exchange factor GrpE [bacterium]
MSKIISQNLNIVTFIIFVLLAGIFVALLLLVYLNKNRKDNLSLKLDELYAKIKEDIKFSVAPKHMELSIGVNELMDLAVEVWRIEQRVAKSASNLQENQFKGLENSVQKLKRYLAKYDIEIVDYKNQKYNDGLNLDILSVEKDPTLPEPMVKETIEPTIMCKGQVVRKAKIILISNH